MKEFEEWTEEELETFKKLCTPIVEYMHNNRKCDLYSAIIIEWDKVLLATGAGSGNVCFPFKVPD